NGRLTDVPCTLYPIEKPTYPRQLLNFSIAICATSFEMSVGMSVYLGRVCAASLVACAAVARAGAQTGPVLRGTVVDRTSQRVIPGAYVVLSSTDRAVVTDSVGRFVFSDLPIGTVHLLVLARAFPNTPVLLELKAGDNLETTIALDSTIAGRTPQALPA